MKRKDPKKPISVMREKARASLAQRTEPESARLGRELHERKAHGNTRSTEPADYVVRARMTLSERLALEAYATRAGLSVSEVIRLALFEYMAGEP